MGFSGVITMEIQEILMTEERVEQAVIEDDDPRDLADRLYKEWLEEPHTFEAWDDGKKKEPSSLPQA